MGLLDRVFGKPTVERFAADLVRGLKNAGDHAEYRYDPPQNRILRLVDGKAAGELNLANMFRTYAAAPRGRRADVLRSCVRMGLSHLRKLPEEFELARADLRPRLWLRATIENTRLRTRVEDPRGKGLDMPCVPVGEHLLAGLAYDWPDSVQSVGADDLERWGISLYEALETATANLEEDTEGYAKIGDGFYAFLGDDSYNATRLLLIDRITAFDVKGEHIAFAPGRNVLFVAGSDDPASLEMALELSRNALGEPYPMSPLPLVLRDGAWEDWEVPADHPLAPKFRALEDDWLGNLYADQKEPLEAAYGASGTDLFVASYSGIRKQDDKVVTYAVWAKGVDTLLPRARKIALIASQDDDPAFYSWERLTTVVGDLLEPTEDYPPRYRTIGYPDDAMLAALGPAETL